MFPDGVSQRFINITIVDDVEQEMAEIFHVSLISVSNEAVLGERTDSYITIAKSDYPNGRFYFTGPPHRKIKNPETAISLTLNIERSDGYAGKQILTWQLLGPNTEQRLQEVTDIAHVNSQQVEVTNGQFIWENGEGGRRTMTLLVKPFTGWEIQKTYVIEIVDIRNEINAVDNGEVDPIAANVTIVILKHGDPNGVIGLSALSLIEKEYIEPESGVTAISYTLDRHQGDLGDQQVVWEVVGGDTDISPESGSTLLAAGVKSAVILLNIESDNIPELTEVFQLHIINVIGGATLQANASVVKFSIRHNDDPHGVVEFASDGHQLAVDPHTLERSLKLVMMRRAGLVGSIGAALKITFSQESSMFPLTQMVTFEEQQAEALLTIPIKENIFIQLDSSLTAVITSVVYLAGIDITSPPKVGDISAATVTIPDIAANSHVSFSSLTSEVEENTRRANLTIERIGLYGSLAIDWHQGYSTNSRIPSGFSSGVLSPVSGKVLIKHGERYGMIDVTLLIASAAVAEPPLFAVSLLGNPSTAALGGAKLEPTNVITEIEPNGVVKFKSSKVRAHENGGEVVLTINRLFGSQSSIQVKYSTREGTALGDVDFTSASMQVVTMADKQLTADIVIPLQLDSIAEEDETFTVVLESVEILPTTHQPTKSPRISSYYSDCTVLINANGDPYGLLDVIVEPTQVQESENAQVSKNYIIKCI